MSLDIGWVRRQFPTLVEGPHRDWAFMDNAGGSLVLDRVVEHVARYMREVPVQTGASYAPSVDAAARVATATRSVARLLNVNDSDCLVMGPTSTALLERLARAMAPSLYPGDEVIVTDADHEANISPWLRLSDKGVQIRWWRVNRDSLRLELEDLDELLSEKTSVVAVTHTSNILGRIEPIAEIARRVHTAGARLVVDGVANIPHRHVDLTELHADFYVFSFYKLFGPHHAVLYGGKRQLLSLANLNHLYLDKDTLPYKLQPGAASYELTYGCLGIEEYLEELGGMGASEHAHGRVAAAYAKITEWEAELVRPLLEFLSSRSDVRIIGPESADPAERIAVVSFVVEGRRSSEIVVALEADRIGCRFGHFHAKRLVDDSLGLMGQDGVVRVSLAHYNTPEEVQRLIGALERVLG